MMCSIIFSVISNEKRQCSHIFSCHAIMLVFFHHKTKTHYLIKMVIGCIFPLILIHIIYNYIYITLCIISFPVCPLYVPYIFPLKSLINIIHIVIFPICSHILIIIPHMFFHVSTHRHRLQSSSPR